MNNDNFQVGQFDARIVFGDAAVVPVDDFSQEDVSQNVGAEIEVADSGDVEDRHYRAKHDRNVNQLYLGSRQLLIGHRSVGGAKINKACSHLFDSTAGADGLVVNLDAWVRRVVLAEP